MVLAAEVTVEIAAVPVGAIKRDLIDKSGTGPTVPCFSGGNVSSGFAAIMAR